MTAPVLTPALRFWPLFAIAFGVRLVIVLVGLGLAALRESHPRVEPSIRMHAEIDTSAAWPVEPWYRDDADWLLTIARHGYADSSGPDGQHGAAFLPLMPAILAAAALAGLNIYWVGVLAPNLASAVGMALFAQVAARLTGDRATAIRALVLLNAFPSAFFFSAPYQEAFGLLFTALALHAWQTGRIALASASAGFGCLARLTGSVVGVAALGAWLFDGPRTRRGFLRSLVVFAGCVAGMTVGFAVLWWTVGDPLAGIKSHEAWGRRSASIANFLHAIRSINDPAAPRRLEGGLAILFVILGIRAWIRRGAFWGLLTLLPIAQMAATGTFLSGHRVLLASLPAFIELGDLLKNRLAFGVAVTLFAVVQFILLNSYIHWGFAG